jgi:hypothetical protein
MANEIYSSSYWGKGVCNNTIDWGVVYKDYAGCTPSFNNTYSLSMDGVDDFVDLGTSVNLGTVSTISLWIKHDGSGSTSQTIIGENSYSFDYLLSINWSLPRVYVRFSAGYYSWDGTPIDDTDWHNIIIVRDTTTTAKIYFDGVDQGAPDLSGGTFSGNTLFRYLGNNYPSNTQYFSGNIDEVAIWNNDQTANISTISTSPVVDLASLNPTAWYRMGDNGTWKSPQWLIPENSNKDKFSNYSFQYDGIDDYVDLGTGSALDIFGSDFTISLWAKWGSQTTNSNGFVNFASFTNKAMVGLGFGTQYGKITFGTGTSTTIGCLYDCGSGYDDDNWHNIICIENSGVRSVYVDGVNITSTGSSSSISVGTNNDIGNRARSRYFVGSIDEVAVFNSIVDVATIYNSGVPTDISSLSPVGYWRSENSTFSTNWTVTDNGSGSNDGTSANMTIDDRVGNASNSSNNAVSFNQVEADRKTDAPT